MKQILIGKLLNCDSMLFIFTIALSIFILGVQIGIKHGRDLQLEDMRIKYGYSFSD